MYCKCVWYKFPLSLPNHILSHNVSSESLINLHRQVKVQVKQLYENHNLVLAFQSHTGKHEREAMTNSLTFILSNPKPKTQNRSTNQPPLPSHPCRTPKKKMKKLGTTLWGTFKMWGLHLIGYLLKDKQFIWTCFQDVPDGSPPFDLGLSKLIRIK